MGGKNRIVVDYGDREELVLLACIDPETKEETDISEIEWPHKAKKYNFNSLEEILKVNKDNAEGFVIHFESGLRIKIKLEEYVRLHRLVTGLTKRAIWEMLRDGDNIEELYSTAPDEIYDWVKDTVGELNKQYKDLEFAAKLIFASAYCKLSLHKKDEFIHEDGEEDAAEKRKAFAKIVTSNERIKTEGYLPMMFRMYDGREISDLIWKAIKPEHETY